MPPANPRQAESEAADYVPSIEEDLLSVIDEAEGKAPDDDETAEEAQLAKDIEASAEEGESEDEPEPKAGDEEEAEPKTADSDDEAAETAEETPETPETELEAPPDHWSAEERTAFNGIKDPEARKLVLDTDKARERRLDAKYQGLAEERRESEALRDAFKPFEQDMALHGVSRIDGLKRLVAGHALLTSEPDKGFEWLAQQAGYRPRDPGATLQGLAKTWGVDPAKLGETPTPSDDPLANEVTALRSDLQQLRQAQTDSQNATRQASAQAAQDEVRAFMQATDEQGNLKHPHMQKVGAQMAALMHADANLTIADAYEQACMANPEIRKGLLDAQLAERTKAAETKRRAVKAKKAGKVHKGETTGGAKADDDMELGELIESVVAAAS